LLVDQQQEVARTREQSHECIFWRQAELPDLARKYRRLNAELGLRDGKIASLSDFYTNKACLIDDEKKIWRVWHSS
jgi:hypothetical protein